MQQDDIAITYEFRYGPEPREIAVTVVLDKDTLEHTHNPKADLPEWTRLGYQQCDVCPLSESACTHCPAAVSLVELVDEFGDLLSYTEVTATVTTRERTVTLDTTLQRALSSLIGLRMATSGCPVLASFKPMARFHLPFATLQETLFRAAGAYLLAQYFRQQQDGEGALDLSGLRDIYRQIHQVNAGLSRRLRCLAGGDANLNALVLLDMFAQHLPWSIDANLKEMAHLFAPYLRPAGANENGTGETPLASPAP